MPSKDPVQRFEDILENIALIQQFTAGMDLAAFMEDLKTYAAVERCLERLSEAAKKLGEVAEELCPGIPWPKVRSLGNLLRHEYDRIEGFRLWYVVEDDLPPLQAAVTAALQKLRERDESS